MSSSATRLRRVLCHLPASSSAVVAEASEIDGIDAELIYRGEPKRCRVANARGRGHTLERDGFMLSSLPLHLAEAVDLYDVNVARKNIYPMCSAVLHDAFPGCTKVIVFDHILRNAQRYGDETGGGATPASTPMLDAPILGAHGDYTARSGFSRARQLLAPHELPDSIDQALGQRFAFVNVWVPLKKVERNPLALLKWSSVMPRDALTLTFTYTHRKGEVYSVLPSDAHRWVYYPDMQAGECIIFKQFDSSEDGRARFAFHTAFDDPSSPASAPPRESMEIRCIVFFGDLPSSFAESWPDLPDPVLQPEHVETGPVTDEW